MCEDFLSHGFDCLGEKVKRWEIQLSFSQSERKFFELFRSLFDVMLTQPMLVEGCHVDNDLKIQSKLSNYFQDF